MSGAEEILPRAAYEQATGYTPRNRQTIQFPGGLAEERASMREARKLDREWKPKGR